MKEFLYKNWEELAGRYDWIADMHGVPQDAVHHAEGDVATHTQMVVKELVGLKEYQNLREEEKAILWIAALLHDVEKRSTTYQETDGSIVSPGHAKKGALTARQILFKQFDVPFETREQIVGLVRHHGLPLWVFHKPDPQKALLQASFEVNTNLVAILAKADVLGRICSDQQDLLDRISFFEEYCKEQRCAGQSYPFTTDLSRFHYFHAEAASVDYLPFDDTTCQVTLMSGLPGMGKDSYIREHLHGLPVISLDKIRLAHKIKPDDTSANGWVAQQAKEQARVYLRAKNDFVWNATNISKQMRSQLIDLFASYRARVRIVYVEQPYKQWKLQNGSREEMVPTKVLERMLAKWEVPKLHEAHSLIYVAAARANG
ncbi:AAA family ATPase [Dyadobacter sp. MSC1_007]|uniref:AAA family ATPase n=1 Tax=Dyadobacter sp. MSC1_007 TaxID=2909264 RepID=UPI00202EAEA8|nr:AAA family ATPase [Dyadobacter sp. MSC1_007]